MLVELPKLSDKAYALVEGHVENGWVSKRKHPKYDLWIYNYTTNTQIERYWNKTTIMCRGLVLDYMHRIVGRPFPKFFNVDELRTYRNNLHHLFGMKFTEIPRLRFTAYPKMDGSLGVIYFNPQSETWELASRGSFESDQAVVGNRLLQTKYADMLRYLKIGHTYLVEIIYPENRIVLDYKGLKELTLLAVIDNETGLDNWDDFRLVSRLGWECVRKQLPHVQYLDQLQYVEPVENEEGYVLVFDNGFRMKYKFAEYCRLHKIMTGVTPRRVWEQLRANADLSQWLDKVPDEFYQYVTDIADKIKLRYKSIEDDAKAKLNEVLSKGGSRKDIANRLVDYDYKSIIFNMLDNKDYSETIWRLVQPRGQEIDE
jgi:RNA ligase